MERELARVADAVPGKSRLGPRDDLFRMIVDGLPAHVALMTPTGELELANRQVLEYHGKTLDELKGWATSDAVHPEDLPAVTAAWKRSVDTCEPYAIEHRIRRADGIYRWFHVRGFPLRNAGGHLALWHVTLIDVDDQKRAEALLQGERQLLEMAARDHSMSDIVDAICRLVERATNGCLSSVVLVDPSGTRLEYGAAPSLPHGFIDSLLGQPISVDSGPCAMAMNRNEQVIAADLASETRWSAYEWYSLALARGLRACASTPISSTTGTILGALALYYDEPRKPTPRHQSLIEQFTHIAGIAIERTRNDAALRRSEARKAAILDSAMDCIVAMDHEGRITEFNPAAERTFGYRRDEVLGAQLADIIIPPSLRERHRHGLARYLATGDGRVLGKRVEMTAVRADGTEFPVEVAITRIPLDGPASFTGYLRDITERKRSEEGLRHSEALLAEAQRLSLTGSFYWRVALDTVELSEQTFRMYELDPSQTVTLQMIASRIHPDDMPILHDMVGRARGPGLDLDHEYRLLMPDSAVKYMHLVAHATRDKDGQLEYIGAIQDVTQRRRSDEALGKARSELAHVARVTSLGALTASIAHEVNQPLSGIITNASTCLRMLAADPPNIDGALETARRALRDGNRASDVINRLRALFSKSATSAEGVDLNEAIREVIALSSTELQRNRVIVRAELAADLPPVTGDRVQLQQVILNLLLNASDAMSVVDDRPRQLVIRTALDDDEPVQLSVQDVGVGFEADAEAKLFDAFYTTKRNGMGIGLSVSRSIIESHGGGLWATANEGPGATISFSLPRRTET